MNKGIFKNVLAVVLGAVTAMILISLGEYAMLYFFPLPPGTDLKNPDAIAKVITQMPTNAFIFLLVNYMTASFAGGIVAAFVSKRKKPNPPVVVGGLLTIAGIINAFRVPNPVWFTIANLFVYIPLAYSGYLVVRKKKN